MVESGGVELLLAEIARPPAGAGDLSLPTAIAAARVLQALLAGGTPATASPFKRYLHERAVAAGALRVAVAGAKQTAAAAPAATCLETIAALAGSGLPGAYEAAADAGGIDALFAALSRTEEDTEEADDGRAAPAAAESLGHLAANLHRAGAGGQLQALLDAGMLPQLVALASKTGKSGKKDNLGSVLRALVALAQSGDTGADAVSASGILPLAVRAIAESDDRTAFNAERNFEGLGFGDRPAKARRARSLCCPPPPFVAAAGAKALKTRHHPPPKPHRSPTPAGS
jgi:hypothetical protein